MALRSGMGTLVERLHRMTQTGTADYTLNGTTYWTDAQLQDVLDRNVLVIHNAFMRSEPEWNNTNLEYYNYYTPRNLGDLETADSGTDYFSIEDASGSEVGTQGWGVLDYNAGWFRRTSDSNGTQYQITARSYNLHAAAAEIWEDKAANVWELVDIRSDGEAMSLSQMVTHAERQAAKHRKLAGAQTTTLPGVW